jgi:hypothetical protein
MGTGEVDMGTDRYTERRHVKYTYIMAMPHAVGQTEIHRHGQGMNICREIYR